MAFMEEVPTYTIIIATFYCLWIVLALTGNSVLAVAILKSRELRSQDSNLLLLSVLFARDLVALCVIPVELLSMLHTEQHLGPELCKICRFAASTSGIATAYSIALLAFERMRSTGSQKKLFHRKWHFVVTLTTMWVLCLAYSSPALFINDLFVLRKDEIGDIWICGTLPRYFEFKRILIIVDAIVVFLIPFIVVLVSFVKVGKVTVKILKTERNNSRNDRNQNGKNPNGVSEVDKHAENKSNVSAIKTMEMTVVMVILFGLCTLTPFVLQILAMWFKIKNMWATSVMFLLVFTNPWVTWVIFLVYRKDLRKAAKGLIFGKEKCVLVFKDIGDLPSDSSVSTVLGTKF